MRWIDDTLPPVALRCAYCEHAADFAHAKSFEYDQHVFSLFECPDCRSLMYHPQSTRVTISRPFTEAYKEDTRLGIKYYVEAGYSPDVIVRCALAAFAGVPAERRDGCLFVDVGAGIGLASVFVAGQLGVETLTIEPSYAGELGREMLGIDIHTVFFEDLPRDVLDRLVGKTCLLHLNSVIEHLHAPLETLRGLMRMVWVETLAANVPDRDYLDFTAPMAAMLPTLAPDDHLHIPTRQGMIRFLAGLGFSEQTVLHESSMLIAVGARGPIGMQGPAELAAAREAYLHGLLQHPNRIVSGGAAARLIDAAAVAGSPALPALRARMLGEIDLATIRQRLDGGESWDTLPFHLATSAFALAKDSMRRLDRPAALAWLDVVEAAAVRLWADHPVRALQSQDYLWSALLYRSHVLALEGRFAAAAAPLRQVIASAGNQVEGARPDQIAGARAQLAELERWGGWWAPARYWIGHSWTNLWLHGRYLVRHRRDFVRYLSGYLPYAKGYLTLMWAYRVQQVANGLGLFGVKLALRQFAARGLVACRSAVARRRDNGVVRRVAGLCRKFLRAYENAFNGDPASNGEGLVLRALASRLAGSAAVIRDVAAEDGRLGVLAAGLEAVATVRVTPAHEAAARDITWRRRGVAKLLVATAEPDGAAILYLRIGPSADVPALLAAFLQAGPVQAVGFSHGPAQAAARVWLRDITGMLEASGYKVFHLLPHGLRPLPTDRCELEDAGGRLFVALAPGTPADIAT